MAAGRAPAAAGRFVETVLEAGRAPSVRAPVPFPVVRPPPPQVEEEVEDEDEDEDDDEPPMRNTYGLWAMCSLVEADITSKLAEIRGAPNDDWPAAYRELCDCVLFFRLPCVRMVFAPKPPKGSREQRTVPSGAVNIPVSMQFDNNTPNSVVTLRTPLTPSSTHPRGPKLKTYTIGDEAAKFLRKFATPFCDTVAHLHQSGAAVPEWAVRCAKDTSGTNQLNDRLYYFVLNKVSKTEGDVFPQPGDPISNENETPCCEFWPQAFPASATPKDILSTLEMKMTELNREARAGRSDVQVSKVCISHAFYNGDLDAMFEQLMPLNPFHQQPVMYRNVTKLPLELEFRSIRKRTLHLTAFEFTQPQLTADALGLISLLIYHTAINTEYVDFLQGALFLFGIHVHDTRGYRVPDTVRESTPVVRRASSRLISSASASLSTSAKRVRRDIPSDEEAPPPQHPDEPDGPDWAQQILLHQEKLQREFQEQQRRYREEQQQQQQQEVQEEVEEEMEEEVQPYQGRYQQQEQQQEAPGLDVDVPANGVVFADSPTRGHGRGSFAGRHFRPVRHQQRPRAQRPRAQRLAQLYSRLTVCVLSTAATTAGGSNGAGACVLWSLFGVSFFFFFFRSRCRLRRFSCQTPAENSTASCSAAGCSAAAATAAADSPQSRQQQHGWVQAPRPGATVSVPLPPGPRLPAAPIAHPAPFTADTEGLDLASAGNPCTNWRASPSAKAPSAPCVKGSFFRCGVSSVQL